MSLVCGPQHQQKWQQERGSQAFQRHLKLQMKLLTTGDVVLGGNQHVQRWGLVMHAKQGHHL